jgi:general secretion pathway protein G
MYRTNRSKGFTLVEILIVVIILGILAAIVIPQFTNASTDARRNSLTSQLQTLRSQMELYKLQHNDKLPACLLSTGADPDAQWVQMTQKTDVSGNTTGTDFGPYLQQNPTNPLNNKSMVHLLSGSPAVDPAFGGAALTSGGDAETGFVINPDTMKIWGTNVDTTKYFDEVTQKIETP